MPPNKKNAFRIKSFNLHRIILIYVFLDKKKSKFEEKVNSFNAFT